MMCVYIHIHTCAYIYIRQLTKACWRQVFGVLSADPRHLAHAVYQVLLYICVVPWVELPIVPCM